MPARAAMTCWTCAMWTKTPRASRPKRRAWAGFRARTGSEESDGMTSQKAASGRNLALLAVGLLLIATGIKIGWSVSRGRGEDLAYMFALSKAVVAGKNVYEPETQRAVFVETTGFDPSAGMYYPPSTGIVLLPLTL